MAYEEDSVIYQPRAKRRQAKYRGPTDAQAINDTNDELLADNTDSASAINTLHSRTFKNMLILQNQLHHLTQRIDALTSRHEQEQEIQATNGETLTYTNDFRSLGDIVLTNFTEEHQARIDPVFGQVTAPINGAVHRFHVTNPATQQIMLPDNLSITITPLDEAGSTVIEGTPSNIFNGDPSSIWMRRVLFPIYSDVSSVQMQIDIDVPSRFSTNANCLYLLPYPTGTVDIDSILYSTSTADPSLALPGFPTAGVTATGPLRYFFSAAAITKIRIVMTQKQWTEYKDQKMFMYGMQELGVVLMEFDKTDELVFLNNNGFVMQASCPAGYTFNNLTDFDSDPDFAVAASDNGIYFKIYTDATLLNEVWDSYADPAMTTLAVPIAAEAVDTIYIVGTLKYQTSTSLTPVLENLYLRYTVV